MKTITTNTGALLNSVAVANTFMPKEGDFLGKMVMVGNDGKLQVKASDLVQTIIYKNIDFVSSDLTDSDFKAFSIDGKRLLTTLKAAKTDEVSIEIHAEHIVIKSGRSKVKIETMANTQTIEIQSGNGSSFDFSSQIGGFEQILHAVDTNNPKFELNGAFLQIKNGVFCIVSTDAKRLAVVTTETTLNDKEVIIPKSGIQTIVKLFKGFNISAEIESTNLSVHTDGISFSTKLINGKFPEWQRIVPQTLTQRITVDRYRLSELLKEASLFDSSVSITIRNGEITIKDFEGNTEVVDTVSDTNANIVFGINSRVLLDFLASYNEDNVQIGFNGPNLPIMLIANPNYKEVAMPLVMQAETGVQDDESKAA